MIKLEYAKYPDIGPVILLQMKIKKHLLASIQILMLNKIRILKITFSIQTILKIVFTGLRKLILQQAQIMKVLYFLILLKQLEMKLRSI